MFYTIVKLCFNTILFLSLLNSNAFATQDKFPQFSGDFNKENITKHLKNLNELQKVEFLNSNFYSIYSSDFKLANEFVNQVIQIAKKNGWKKQEASALQNLGVVLYLGGDYVSALPAYLRASDIFDSLNDFNGIASVNNEMSVFYRKQNDFQKSLSCLNKAEQIARNHNLLASLSTTLHNRATIYLMQDSLSKAEPIINEVYKIRKEIGDSVGLGYILLNLSEIATKKGQIKPAISYVEEALDIRKKINDKQGIAICYVVLGETYMAFDKYQLAIKNFQSCLDESLKIGFTDLSRYTYQMLAECYDKEGLFKEAFINQKYFQKFNDSLFNVEKAKNLNELQTKYETEKKEQQIKIQELTIAEQEAELRKNRIQVASSVGGIIVLIVVLGLLYNAKRLREQVLALETTQKLQSERERISSDLHDHVGAQLTSIISGLQMTETVGGNNQSPQFKQLVESLKEDAQVTITHLRDTIWTLKEEEITPSEFAEHIQKFAESALRYREKPVFNIHNSAAETIKLNPSVALNLTRVLEEAIHNTIKHAEAENLDINIQSIKGRFQIEVKDNGKGFILNAKNGGEHYGLENMKRRVEELGGSLKLISKIDHGLSVLIDV